MATSSSKYKTVPPNNSDSDDDDAKECKCSIMLDVERDVNNLLNSKLEEARKELEDAVSLYLLLHDIKLTAIQRKKQNDMIISMYRYVVYLQDLKNRKGRCKYCVEADSANN